MVNRMTGKMKTVTQFAATKLIAICAALLLVVSLFGAAFPAKAHAASIVKKVSLYCDVDKGSLLVDNAEYQAQNILLYNSDMSTSTEGVTLENAASYLTYWNEEDSMLHGIGEGEGLVNKTRSYYLLFWLELQDGYDWPDSVKQLGADEQASLVNVSGFRVDFNGVERGDCVIGYNSSWNAAKVMVPIANNFTGEISAKSFTYNGRPHKPSVTSVTTLYGTEMEEEDYYYFYVDTERDWVKSPVNAGKYYVVIQGEDGIYNTYDEQAFTIKKAANPMKVKGKTAVISYGVLKKKTVTLARSKVLTISKAQGKLTFRKISGSPRIKISKTTGKVTVKKGTRRGLYKVRVKVKAAGNRNYNASAWKTATFKVRVK